MKRIVSSLCVLMLLSLVACGDSSTGENQTPSGDVLSELRSGMQPPVIAVADFGFPSLSDEYGIMDYLSDEYPVWMTERDFIGRIPEERIIRTCDYEEWGNLVCVVPRDPKATVSVHVSRYTEASPDWVNQTAFHSESGEPILLLASMEDGVSVSVEVTDSEGRGVIWTPYWETEEPIPEEAYSGALVMYFSPLSEKTAYENAEDYGWTMPDESFYTDHYWRSDWGYDLELRYNPGELYDGEAYIYEVVEGEAYAVYKGNWLYENGHLCLNMADSLDASSVIQEAYPILLDPYGEGWLGIFRTEVGLGLPWFEDGMAYDELMLLSGGAVDHYANALNQGWYVPEFGELLNTEWLSVGNYALDLMDDSVPDDSGGNVTIYDVNDNGAYSTSYTGSWDYGNGMLHLTLVPQFGDGYFVDDSFPVLMQDGELWIGRNENGIGLPYFYEDQFLDVLEQPKG